MRLLDYTQAAERLGVKVPTLRSMVCRKQVPHIRLSGKLVRFDAAELDAWLRGHCVPANEDNR